MPIDVLCPGCGKTLRIADAHAGKKGRCPQCQTMFHIPGGETNPTPAANPPAPTTPAKNPNAWPPSPPTPTPQAPQPQAPVTKPTSVFDTPAQPTTPANTPTNNPPAKKFDVFAGLDTGSKSAPAASQQDKPNLFGDYQATPSSGSSNPFGDSNQQDEGENDFSNPYATPKTSSPMGSMGASSPSSSNQSTIAIILGISSLVFMGMGLCCCPLFLGSMLMSSIGLFLSYRLPKQSRLLPLILNWIAMGLSLLLLTIYIALIALDVSRQRKFQTQFNQTQFNQSQSSPNTFSPSSRSSQQTRTEEMHQEMMNKHREMMEKMKSKSR